MPLYGIEVSELYPDFVLNSDVRLSSFGETIELTEAEFAEWRRVSAEYMKWNARIEDACKRKF